MGEKVRLILLCLLLPLALGCAKPNLIALVPDPDGKVGSISVTTEGGSVVIDAPYRAARIADAKEPPGAPVQLDRETLDAMFAEALSVQPKPPLHFLLYFEKETVLTSASAQTLPGIVATIRERDSNYISVIGHTDTVGSREFNTELSQRRARAVQDLLVREGVPAESVSITSHGKENPLVPTDDNVFEPRNRRVEVVVR